MGSTRLAITLVGLVVVVAAVWVFLTQTTVGRSVPYGLAIALVLLLVGIGIMASATSINDRKSFSRVTHDAPLTGPSYAAPGYVRETRYEPGYTAPAPPSGETVVEERRMD